MGLFDYARHDDDDRADKPEKQADRQNYAGLIEPPRSRPCTDSQGSFPIWLAISLIAAAVVLAVVP